MPANGTGRHASSSATWLASEELIEAGFVSHQATTGNGGYETAEDIRTPSHESPARSDTGAPTSDEVEEYSPISDGCMDGGRRVDVVLSQSKRQRKRRRWL